jgi:hypothetical protein
MVANGRAGLAAVLDSLLIKPGNRGRIDLIMMKKTTIADQDSTD